jgi:propionyl-CoA carboxylase alpha chain
VTQFLINNFIKMAVKEHKITKILVANRGEIALRIMRTARDMGISTVAIFSEADQNAPHVKYADETVCVGPPPSSESYLKADTIISVAKERKADAIHPGYGFLSENAEFARKVIKAGLAFIGPSPEAIEIMGDKLAAKEAVSKFKIPLVPGTEHAIHDPDEAIFIAKEIGFPVLIKASAGGGGKGMRVVHKEADLEEEMQRAISEAISAFGDGSVFLEKYIESNKHIEFQILGDQHGNIIHLFERECSIQRRHQKVIEEAPSMVLTEELRKEMGEAAVNVAKACGYFGAGTVEFIFDENQHFYFLEMNTRLQVEHPVTEEITGIDLVREQIHIAEGKKLSIDQDDVKIKGHAIELRVYAEDPANDFLPDIGTLEVYSPPMGPGIRVDDGFRQGMEIPIYYDPMISKLIAVGKNRDEARSRMLRAIDEYIITGIETTLDFGRFLMSHHAFIDGSFNTHFVKKYFNSEEFNQSTEATKDELDALSAAAAFLVEESKTKHIPAPTSNSQSRWKLRNR